MKWKKMAKFSVN